MFSISPPCFHQAKDILGCARIKLAGVRICLHIKSDAVELQIHKMEYQAQGVKKKNWRFGEQSHELMKINPER